MDSHESNLWDAYEQDASPAARNALVEHYLPRLRRTANLRASRLPPNVDPLDLEQTAVIDGLLPAIARFERGRGWAFWTYALPRIQGAMSDFLREAMDDVPRLTRRRANELDAAEQALVQVLGRRPRLAELARVLGWTERQVAALTGPDRPAATISLDEPRGESEAVRELAILDRRPAGDPTPDRIFAARFYCRRALRGLGKRERLVLLLYYCEQQTMRAIGETLGLSESRISQIHDRILAKLREREEKLKE